MNKPDNFIVHSVKVFNYCVSALSNNLSHFKARYSCINVT
ncbi:hypothetical protein PUND_b0759 [Pseudoalteromonas undina]|nr:hypothetical protein PUND_b0759 [Pseudoalteromonas undina]